MKKRKSIIIFLKAQLSAFSGGITDYALMIFLTEILHLHFVFSILISGTVGGIVNFSLNRLWAFKNQSGYSATPQQQLTRFVGVVLGSISLKSAGTYLLHRTINLDYRIGRLLIDSIVSYGFNYPLMKHWVFRSSKAVQSH